jgi:phosphate transport system substrate-binding protein
MGHFVRRILAPVLLLCALLFSGGCSRVTEISAQPATLRIAGSTTMLPVLTELGAAFQAAHPNASVVIRGGGSEIGLKALDQGSADLAAVSWEMGAPTETDGLRPIPIGRDGLTLIVNPKNRVAGLTTLQLRALYRGEILDWQAVGGPSSEPVVISRESGSGDRAAFEALVMGGERVTLNALMLPTAQTVADYVARHPGAIGYVSMAQRNESVRVVPIEGISPSPDEVRSGAYHLGRLLYLVLPRAASPAARAFVDFALSPAGQRIVAAHHVSLR